MIRAVVFPLALKVFRRKNGPAWSPMATHDNQRLNVRSTYKIACFGLRSYPALATPVKSY